MSDAKRYDAHGPFRAEHVKPGDNWEISDGRPIECAPTGGMAPGAPPQGRVS